MVDSLTSAKREFGKALVCWKCGAAYGVSGSGDPSCQHVHKLQPPDFLPWAGCPWKMRQSCPGERIEINLQTNLMISPQECREWKIRKAVFCPGGLLLRQYGLSWRTGEWIEVPRYVGLPPAQYPEETLLAVKRA